MFAGLIENNLYIKDIVGLSGFAFSFINNEILKTWHTRLGNLERQNFMKLAKNIATGIHLPKPLPLSACEPCSIANFQAEAYCVGIQGHAMVKVPTGVACALLFIVKGYSQGISLLLSSLFSLIHLIYKSFYHIFHQVISQNWKEYSLMKHSIVLYILAIVYLVLLQVCQPQKSEWQNAIWPCYNNNHQPSTNKQMLFDTV